MEVVRLARWSKPGPEKGSTTYTTYNQGSFKHILACFYLFWYGSPQFQNVLLFCPSQVETLFRASLPGFMKTSGHWQLIRTRREQKYQRHSNLFIHFVRRNLKKLLYLSVYASEHFCWWCPVVLDFDPLFHAHIAHRQARAISVWKRVGKPILKVTR